MADETPETQVDEAPESKGVGDLTIEELKDMLDKAGVEYRANDRKSDLIEKLEAWHEANKTPDPDPQIAVAETAASDFGTTVPGGRYITADGRVVNAHGETIED